MRDYTIAQVLEHKAVAIVRGAGVEDCIKVADALYEGGIRLMEITFNQKNPDSFKDTAAAIKKAVPVSVLGQYWDKPKQRLERSPHFRGLLSGH